MAEYIKREALVAELAKGTIITDDIYGTGIMTGIGYALTAARKIPAADVVPVVHGKWTEKDNSMYDPYICENVHWSTYICSECNREVMKDFNYCPNCGCRMDGR